MTTLNIRNVDPQTARWLKSEAALRGLTLAQMLDLFRAAGCTGLPQEHPTA